MPGRSGTGATGWGSCTAQLRAWDGPHALCLGFLTWETGTAPDAALVLVLGALVDILHAQPAQM